MTEMRLFLAVFHAQGATLDTDHCMSLSKYSGPKETTIKLDTLPLMEFSAKKRFFGNDWRNGS